jgi:sec-independent protein translocase protein TatB
VFGMSAGEIGIILIVGLVIVGPKKLPEMMRSLGKWIAKLRKLSTTLRDQSGIDRILKEEGLDKEIRELRALRESLSKSAVLESLMQAANKPASSPVRPAVAKSLGPKPPNSEPAKTPDPGPPGASTPPLPEKPATTPTSEDAAKAEAAHKEEAAKASEATKEEPNKVAVGSDGSATTSSALGLVHPAVGSIPRGGTGTPAAPVAKVYDPLPSFREREYPAFGPDHYEAFPDDLADDEEMIEPGKIGENAGVLVTQPEPTIEETAR